MAAQPKEKTAQEKNAEYNKEKAGAERRMKSAERLAKSAVLYSVKRLNDKTLISYTLTENNANNDYELLSDDSPTDGFLSALAALAPHVAKIIFYGAGEQQHQQSHLDIKGVTWKYHEGENIHAGITSVLELTSGRTITVNTPVMPLHSDNQAASTHTKEAAEAIGRVMEETRAFLGGRRANGNLFAKAE